MDIIQVNNLRLRAVLGFSKHELETPQDIVISLRIGADSRLAGETDDPADACNYKPVAKAIIQLVEGSRFALVEKLAEEIARLAIVDFGVPYIEVSLHKPGALRRSDSVGICIERRVDDYRRNIVFVSLGSNIAPEQNILAAVRLLRRYTTVLAVSPVYRSLPQGFAQQDPFLNMAVKIHTLRAPSALKSSVIDRIEAELKRVRDPHNKNAPRTIDLDISLWNEAIIEYGAPSRMLPDPDILRFAHVAIPLADIMPEYKHPTENVTLGEIAARFDTSDIQRVDLTL